MKLIMTKLQENRKAARDFYRKEEAEEEDVVSIMVKTDGTYQKRCDRNRGYTSKVGVILITDANTD